MFSLHGAESIKMDYLVGGWSKIKLFKKII